MITCTIIAAFQSHSHAPVLLGTTDSLQTPAFALAMLPTVGVLLLGAAGCAGCALLLARVLGVDRMLAGIDPLPAVERCRWGVAIGWIGIGVGAAALLVMLGMAPPTLLSSAWAASAVFAALMGAMVLLSARQAREARAWAARTRAQTPDSSADTAGVTTSGPGISRPRQAA